ncbi:uncharacterized protein LOC144545813 [Carex rostrata]
MESVLHSPQHTAQKTETYCFCQKLESKQVVSIRNWDRNRWFLPETRVCRLKFEICKRERKVNLPLPIKMKRKVKHDMEVANDPLELFNLDSDDEHENQTDVCSFLLHEALELENFDSDDEYENQSDDETEDEDEDDNDERTIEEDEVKITEADMKEEVVALKTEADLPLEEILKAYPKKTIRSSRESIQVSTTDTDEPPFKKHKTNNAATGFLARSKTLEITDYSVLKKVIKTGNYIQSDIFTVSGYQWTIEFYPQGWDSSSSDFISIGVRLINPMIDVKAISTHRFHDWNTSTWSTDTLVDSNVDTFSSTHTRWGYFRFIRRSDFETSSYLRNDTLVIKTNLWVANDISRW